MGSNRLKTGVVICAAGILATLSLAYVLWRFNGKRSPDTCISEQLKAIPNVAGMGFYVEYVNCDALAKDESVSVYITSAWEEKSRIAKPPSDKTLIFRYDPGGRVDVPSPSIQASGRDHILISIPDVSSVSFEARKWRHISIDYKIGHIAYP
jgi:hypothetical protein